MEDLGEQVGRKLACAVGSDLPSGTAPPADSTPLDLAALSKEFFWLPWLAGDRDPTASTRGQAAQICFDAEPERGAWDRIVLANSSASDRSVFDFRR